MLYFLLGTLAAGSSVAGKPAPRSHFFFIFFYFFAGVCQVLRPYTRWRKIALYKTDKHIFKIMTIKNLFR